MSLNLVDLDQRTRQLMLQELEMEIAQGTLSISPYLTLIGREFYPSLLRKAIRSQDEVWLVGTLRGAGLIELLERKTLPNGIVEISTGPGLSVATLVEREFNRLFCCALCLRAMEDHIPHVSVYRAKQVECAGVESEDKVGQQFEPQLLLENLRALRAAEPALGISHELDSGLSIKLPDFTPEVG
jgi:hypothetical protein